MIKRVSLVRRKRGLSRGEFLAHWMGPHANIVLQLPGVRGLRFNVVERWSPAEAAWDGVGELWFDGVADAERAFSTEPYLSMLVEDREKFLGEGQWCFVEEHSVVSPPSST